MLEEENRRLKRLVADLALDNAALKDVLSKNFHEKALAVKANVVAGSSPLAAPLPSALLSVK